MADAAREAQPAPPAAEPGSEKVGRRSFLAWLLGGWFLFAAALAAGFAAAVRFLFPNVLFEPPQTFEAGWPGQYAVGQVDTRWKQTHGVWLVRNEEGFFRCGSVLDWLAFEFDRYLPRFLFGLLRIQ